MLRILDGMRLLSGFFVGGPGGVATLAGGVESGGSNPLNGLNRAPVVPLGCAGGAVVDPACFCRVGVALTSCLLAAWVEAKEGGVLCRLGGGAPSFGIP